MQNYKITITDNFTPRPMSGTFQGENENEAIFDAKDFYSNALDTDMDAIEIISCELL